tara:strand:- start:358 stop:1083 length:726 start_codon:yes stop_codon:yes gene_type:complete
MMSLSIIIPTYNEVKQLKYTIKKLQSLKKKIKEYELIFIDDFSNDGSYQQLVLFKKKDSRIKIFKNIKKGLGSAIKVGIKKSKKKYVCIFMCDLSDDVNDIYKYYKAITDNKKLDAVFGTRFDKNSKVINYPFFKLMLNRIANNVIKILFLSNYNDFTNAFKIYKKKVLLKLFPIVSENFNIFLELPLKIITRKLNYKIIPINWYGRKIGESKFKIKEIGSKYVYILLYCFIEKILLNKKK